MLCRSIRHFWEALVCVVCYEYLPIFWSFYVIYQVPCLVWDFTSRVSPTLLLAWLESRRISLYIFSVASEKAIFNRFLCPVRELFFYSGFIRCLFLLYWFYSSTFIHRHSIVSSYLPFLHSHEAIHTIDFHANDLSSLFPWFYQSSCSHLSLKVVFPILTPFFFLMKTSLRLPFVLIGFDRNRFRLCCGWYGLVSFVLVFFVCTCTPRVRTYTWLIHCFLHWFSFFRYWLPKSKYSSCLLRFWRVRRD